MMMKPLTAATLIFAAAVVCGDETPDGAAVMQHVRANRPALSLKLDATLTIQRRVADSFDLAIYLNGSATDARSVYRVTAPPEAAGTTLLLIEKGGLWLAEPAKDAPRALPPADMAKPFLDSDFAFEDLNFSFLRWPNQKFVKESRRLGFDCWVVESMPGPNDASQYNRVLSWVDKNYTAVVIAEAYDAKGKLLKTLKVESVRKLDDKSHYIPGQITMENAQTKSRTVLRVTEDHPGMLDASLFTPESVLKLAK